MPWNVRSVHLNPFLILLPHLVIIIIVSKVASSLELSQLLTPQTLHLSLFLVPAIQKIVYSTCSIHAIENEQVVSQALASPEAQAGGFILASKDDVLPAWERRGIPEKMSTANPERGTLTLFLFFSSSYFFLTWARSCTWYVPNYIFPFYAWPVIKTQHPWYVVLQAMTIQTDSSSPVSSVTGAQRSGVPDCPIITGSPTETWKCLYRCQIKSLWFHQRNGRPRPSWTLVRQNRKHTASRKKKRGIFLVLRRVTNTKIRKSDFGSEKR